MGCQCITGSAEKNSVWSEPGVELIGKKETENLPKSPSNDLKFQNLNHLTAQQRKSISYMISVANSEDKDRRMSMGSLQFNVSYY